MTLPLPLAPVIIVQIAIAPVLAAMSARNRAPRAAIPVALAASCAPFLVAPIPIARTWLGLCGTLYVLRTVDLARDRRPSTFLGRLWLLVSVFDTREAKPAPRRLDLVAAASLAGDALAFAVGLWLVLRTLPRESVAPWARAAARSFGCAGMTLGLVGSGAALTRLGYALGGIDVPRVQNAPLLSKSVGEFWSVRWNRTVRGWLRRNAFMPVTRRLGVAAGVIAAFVASALIHFWLALPNVGPLRAVEMASFFVVHGGIVLFEAQAGVSGRVWTFACFVVTVPIFAEPMLGMLGL
jgi:hypothetical protein